MKDFLTIFKYRKLIAAISVIIVIAACIPMLSVHIDSDLRKYFPEKSQSLQNTNRIEESFGTTEPILLLYESENIFNHDALLRFKSICEGIGGIPGVEKVISVFSASKIHSGGGFMAVDPAVPFIPETKEETIELEEWTADNDLIFGKLVSKNYRYALAMVNRSPDASDESLNLAIDSVLGANPGTDRVLVAGEPQLRMVVNRDIRGDLYVLLPVGLLLMIVFLWLSFRSLRAVMIPLFVVVLSVVFAIGLMPLLGWNLSIISILVPVMMLAISNNYGVHFVSGYIEDALEKPDSNSQALVSSLFDRLKMPVLFTGLTTIAGILTMLTHVMIPARQTGVSAAWGVSMALIISLIIVPLLLFYGGKPIVAANRKRTAKSTQRNRFIESMSGFVVKRPGLLILLAAIGLLAAATGIFGIKVDPNAENVLPRKHDYLTANALINEQFGGCRNFSIMVKGDIKDPAVLRRIDTLESELRKMPQVGNVLSIAGVMRTMTSAVCDSSDAMYGEIPDSREAVAQMFELYSMGGDPSDFEQLVDFNFEKAVITVQFKAETNADYKAVFDRTDELIESQGLDAVYGGFALMTYEMIDAIIRGQVYSLIISVLLVFILLLIIFKSFRYALLGCIPLSATIVIMFGLMGFFGVPVNVVTALISSVVVGIGVDYTIHFLYRYTFELKNGLTVPEAVFRTLTTTGRGIIINSLSVMLGFVVLLLSSFVALQNFALLMISALSLCLIFSLIVVPAICVVANKKRKI
ncbi:MAG TPA: efflux RND transporter permease subunit [Bacteroidales bacterium]|nr:efflux RND transporter permease subunit [Bacteroidales bacterium]